MQMHATQAYRIPTLNNCTCVCVCASTLHELRVHVHYRAIISGSIRRHHFLCFQTPCLDVTNKCINTSTKAKVNR